MDKIYAQAYYRAHLNWDWAYVNSDGDRKVKLARWSKAKNWIFKRMQKLGKLQMLSEITRSLD